MKRIAIAAITAVMVLVAAGTAYAAINNYTASYTFHGAKGTPAKPAPLSFEQKIVVTPATVGDRTGILHQIKTQITGAKFDLAGFPTCTAAKIGTAQNDTGCPKKALVATGSITATLGAATDFTQAGAACDPELHVWNGGGHKLIFFFVDTAAHPCLGGQLHTGQVPPWTATYRQAGSKLDITIPIPDTVDYPLGVNGGEVGSLSGETLHYVSQSMGSTHSVVSTGCSGGMRKFTFGFSATVPTSPTAEVKSLTGAVACG